MNATYGTVTRQPGDEFGNQTVLVLNPGGEDRNKPFVQPLPVKTRAELKIINLYGIRTSTSTSKVRMVLHYYQVPFNFVHTPPAFNRKGGDGTYKKVPVVVINEQYEIRDSFAILKTLAPILQGRPLTDREIAIEEMTTYKLMIAMQIVGVASCARVCRSGNVESGSMGCLIRCFSGMVCIVFPANFKNLNPGLESLEFFGEEYNKYLEEGKQPYLAGDTPGVVDISLAALIALWNVIDGGESEVNTRFLGPISNGSPSPLRAWWMKMEPQLPTIWDFPTPVM